MLDFTGAAEGIRTPDPRITNAVLYQLSYRGLPPILLDILSPRHCRSIHLLPKCYILQRCGVSLASAAAPRQRASRGWPGASGERARR